MELTNERTKVLKDIYETGNMILNEDEIYILNNAIREYAKQDYNEKTKKQIEELTVKLCMLFSKNNAKISKELKSFVKTILKKEKYINSNHLERRK